MRRSWRLSLVILLLPLLSGCSGILFQPERGLRDNPVARRFAPRDVWFDAADGVRLHGWYFTAPHPKGTVVVLHGNAENLSTHVNGVLWLVPAGFNLFIFDYRGYGLSTGQPDLPGVHRDALAAIRAAALQPETDPQRIAVLGQSIGGGIAVTALASTPDHAGVRALVLDSPCAGYRRIVREKAAALVVTWPLQYPISWMFDDAWSAERHVASLAPLPLLVIHGSADTIVPQAHGKRLYELAGEPKAYWPTGAEHIASFADAEIRDRLAVWLEQKLALPPASRGRGD